MSTKKVSQLNATTSLAKNDLLLVVDTSASESKKATFQSISRFASVKDYGATGDGVTDDRAAIKAAIDDNIGGVVFFPEGTYMVSQYVAVSSADNTTLCGSKGAIISYPSSDTNVTAGTTGSIERARSAFYCTDSDHLTFRDLRFQGDSVETDITVNVGRGIYLDNCANATIQNCRNDYGASLWLQDGDANDVGLRAIGNTSYACRGVHNSGSEASIIGNRFEQPTAVGYDRVGSDGSSHGLYFYAGRNNVIVSGNVFKNIRVDGVKCSGTANTIYNFTITGNSFIDCACGVAIQSDNASDSRHTGFIVNNNTFYDCGTNRQGWFQDAAVRIAGVENCDVSHNTFFYSRHAVYNLAGTYGIEVKRFNASLGTPSMDNITITDNSFTSVEGLTPSSIITYPIVINDSGQGGDNQGCAIIRGNNMFGVGSVGVVSQKNIGLIIESNVFANLTTCISMVGDKTPVVRNNVLISTDVGSNNSQLRLNGVSFPVIDGNVTQGRTDSSYGGYWSIGYGEGAAAQTPVDFPLCGSHGKATPNAGKQEAVFAYGDGWQDNDTITIDLNTYTYKGTTPGAGQFNSIASLIALIDAETDLTAVDYGDPWSISTGHILVRDAAANGAAWDITKSTARKTAGVLLTNDTTPKLTSRGGQASPGSLTLIWSPLASLSSTPVLVADNSAAASLLASNSFYTSGRANTDGGSVTMIEHGNISGTEEFRWMIK